MRQSELPLGPTRAQFFHDGLHYHVHREEETIIITYNGLEYRRFRYGTERTPLEQQAQWKIEQEDPLLVLPVRGDDNAET